MPRSAQPTRDRIVATASRLFYSEGIRGVSVDAVADAAGLTKRTLYYHFKSKDDLVAAYLEARDQPNLALFKRWFTETKGSSAAKVQGIFRNLARSARHPKWKGCGFLRTSAELANMPGHPAIKIGAAHKKKFEAWLRMCSRRRRREAAHNWPGRLSCCSTDRSRLFCCTAMRPTWRPRVRLRFRWSARP